MEFCIEKCAMLLMSCGRWQITEGIELPNQEIIRTCSEKKTYMYLGILDERKKLKENILGERVNNSEPNYVIEVTSIRWIHGLSYS